MRIPSLATAQLLQRGCTAAGHARQRSAAARAVLPRQGGIRDRYAAVAAVPCLTDTPPPLCERPHDGRERGRIDIVCVHERIVAWPKLGHNLPAGPLRLPHRYWRHFATYRGPTDPGVGT